ncbi:hypothetical protein RB195_013335 [Necator americanus]|uniref:Reverse transcriptase domain-containing protein n=1 Tax=Necator americanus TaxID=51031 RepID=A0ABR1DXR5_NECAM
MTEMWQRHSKPVQLAFAKFKATFDFVQFFNIRADGVPRKLTRLIEDMNKRSTAAVRTLAERTSSFEMEAGVRQGAVARSF